MSFIKGAREALGTGPFSGNEYVQRKRFRGVSFRIQDREDQLDATGSQPSFISSISRISDIEALGSATKGLKAVAQIAQAGGPGLTNIINKGASGVLDTVMTAGSGGKFGANTIYDKVSKVNPSAVNIAVSQSADIAEKLKDGKFNLETIPSYTRDFANVFKIATGIADAVMGKGAIEEVQVVQTAQNMAKILSDTYGGVKLPYRYVVQFKLRPEYAALEDINPTFFIKTCDRPSMEYETDDVNYYNFRSSVIKRASFKPINMTFYDDQVSTVLGFLRSYVGLISPITNNNGVLDSLLFEHTGMNFGQVTNLSESVSDKGELSTRKGIPGGDLMVPERAATVGELADQTISQSILSGIIIYHFSNGGAVADIYVLRNPKIVDIQLDDLDHSKSDANQITLTWRYDNAIFQPFVTDENLSTHSLHKHASNDPDNYRIASETTLVRDFAKPAMRGINEGGEGSGITASEPTSNGSQQTA